MKVYVVTLSDIGYDHAEVTLLEAFGTQEEADQYISEVSWHRELCIKARDELSSNIQEWQKIYPAPQLEEARPVFNNVFQGDKAYNKQHCIAVQAWNAKNVAFSNGPYMAWSLRKENYSVERACMINAKVFEGSGLNWQDYEIQDGTYEVEAMTVGQWTSKVRPTGHVNIKRV